jgi:hypothetical protein
MPLYIKYITIAPKINAIKIGKTCSPKPEWPKPFFEFNSPIIFFKNKLYKKISRLKNLISYNKNRINKIIVYIYGLQATNKLKKSGIIPFAIKTAIPKPIAIPIIEPNPIWCASPFLDLKIVINSIILF